MPCGSRREACVIAPCTSTAAPSRLRLSANSSVICVEPSELTDVICSSPEMVENWFSSGVATEAPIVSGLAPGSCAVTSSVGKSTFGRSLTGSSRYATRPNSAIAAMSRLVAIGRVMKPWEIFKEEAPGDWASGYGPWALGYGLRNSLNAAGTWAILVVFTHVAM